MGEVGGRKKMGRCEEDRGRKKRMMGEDGERGNTSLATSGNSSE